VRSDLTLMISRTEIERLTDTFGVDPELMHYTPFMLPPLSDAAIRQLPGFEQRAHFLTIGNFRHAPNWDAVLWLKESLWPRIREQLPRAELHIYGAYPPPKATALHNERQGFLIKGWAEDAAQVLTWPLPVADEADDFAAAAVALYRDPQRWSRCQKEGTELYNRHFGFQPHADALIRRLQQLRSNLNQHRLNNFTGAMLRHHTLKSTQYMAQWIEAKQKNASLPND